MKYVLRRQFLNEYELCMLTCFLINFWPIIPTGNFFSSSFGNLTIMPFIFIFLSEKFKKWNPENILKKTGIQERGKAGENITAGDLAIIASEKLFAASSLPKNSIDVLIFITQTPNQCLPSTSCEIHAALGLKQECGAFDVNQGCAGYIYGLNLASSLIDSASAKYVLLLTGDTYTKYSNFRLNANDANSRLSRNQKIKYYVELPIPQEVNDSNIVTWGDDTMNIFQLAGVAAATAVMENPNKSFQNVLDVLQGDIQLDGLSPELQKAIRAGFSGAAINALGGNVNRAGLIARATGQVLNSNLELLFGGVNLRTFPFSITFTPRYYEEMLEVKKIIRQFKMAMAAKAGQMNGGSASGIFLQSPDVFSLRYMHNGQDHPFLNSFKMCALTGMNVNYTNAGAYASYEDGTPVSIRMNLTFKELNPIYSEDYDGMSDDQGVGF